MTEKTPVAEWLEAEAKRLGTSRILVEDCVWPEIDVVGRRCDRTLSLRCSEPIQKMGMALLWSSKRRRHQSAGLLAEALQFESFQQILVWHVVMF